MLFWCSHLGLSSLSCRVCDLRTANKESQVEALMATQAILKAACGGCFESILRSLLYLPLNPDGPTSSNMFQYVPILLTSQNSSMPFTVTACGSQGCYEWKISESLSTVGIWFQALWFGGYPHKSKNESWGGQRNGKKGVTDWVHPAGKHALASWIP